ncbi:MAG: acyltransferase family protein [Rhodothermales bacterium]
MLSYREDIDGLRAIAVLAVLGFHVSDKFLPGGFIGVDIFFVISGFLITRIIWKDLDAKTFSFSTFYAKRIKRLFPALIVMLLGCSIVEFFLGMPIEAYTFGEGAIASVFYVSNHFFLSINGYFDASLKLNPLLHTWSLSVEEQFYIFFPGLLYLVFKAGRSKAFLWIVLLLVASFGFSEYLLDVNESAAFFLAPSRFWEFLLGCLIAIWPAKRLLPQSGMEAMGWLGMCMIVFGIFSLSDASVFPGVNALWPALGTALVIFSGQQSGLVISKILSNRIARFFSKISYSLYLWHWPLIVFYKLEINPVPSDSQRIFLILASMLLGYLSWKFVEETTRKISVEKHKKAIYWSGVVSTCCITCIGLVFVLTEGRKNRFSKKELSYIEYLNYDASQQFRTGSCFLTNKFDSLSYFDADECVRIDAEKPNVLIIGDSHAAQYAGALKDVFPTIELSQITASGCLPVLDTDGEHRCTELMKMGFEKTIVSERFDSIILAGRWDTEDVDNAIKTVNRLAEYAPEVVVFGPIIEYNQSLPRLLLRFGDVKQKIHNDEYYQRLQSIDQSLSAAFNNSRVQYYSILDAICPDEDCMLFTDEGDLMQFDSSHLTKSGSVEIISRLREAGLYKNLLGSLPDDASPSVNRLGFSLITN